MLIKIGGSVYLQDSLIRTCSFEAKRLNVGVALAGAGLLRGGFRSVHKLRGRFRLLVLKDPWPKVDAEIGKVPAGVGHGILPRGYYAKLDCMFRFTSEGAVLPSMALNLQSTERFPFQQTCIHQVEAAEDLALQGFSLLRVFGPWL